MTEKIRILIVDDHMIFRMGLTAMLLNHEDLEIVGEASNGEEAVHKADSLHPDVILMDLFMPHKNGIQAITEIKQNSSDSHILVLSTFGEEDRIFGAIKAGASGYILKDALPEELIKAIRDVNAGKASLDPNIAIKLILEIKQKPPSTSEKDVLTARELEVIKLVAHGLTNQGVSEKMNITERTVCAHVSNILNKLHLANRTQAALYALREGIATLNEN